MVKEKSVLNVLVVDDHRVVCKGIELIFKDKIKSVIYTANNHEEALAILSTVIVDLVFLDINIDGVEDFSVIHKIKALQTQIKILIFSGHHDMKNIEYCMKYKADGFLSKFSEEEVIINAVHDIMKGKKHYSYEAKKSMKSLLYKKSENPLNYLSEREFQIAKMISNGERQIVIGEKLDLKLTTVATYKRRIFEKLKIKNIIELADIVLRHTS